MWEREWKWESLGIAEKREEIVEFESKWGDWESESKKS